MGSKLEFVILALLILILAKLYGESFLGMLRILGGWIFGFLVWFVDLIGRCAPK